MVTLLYNTDATGSTSLQDLFVDIDTTSTWDYWQGPTDVASCRLEEEPEQLDEDDQPFVRNRFVGCSPTVFKRWVDEGWRIRAPPLRRP